MKWSYLPVIAVPLLLGWQAAPRQSAYAGAKACAACHAQIYRRQQNSHHARSLRAVEAAPEVTALLPFTFQDRASAATLRLERADAPFVDLSAQKGSELRRLRLQWAFGSGVKAITMIGLREDGKHVEGRLTWYRSLGSFDLTTGATRHTPANILESVGRELTGDEVRKCFECHTTGDTPQVPLQAGAETGIHCESCHGPGREHIQAVTRRPVGEKKISHPGRLDGFAQARMCGTCHGEPPEDTDIAGIRAIETNPNTVRFASPRLVLSRCFNESDQKLKCTTCHNPHEDAAQAAAQSDRTCLSCHTKEVRRKAAVCKVTRYKCASCHMPRERVVAHSSFADHWIRVIK